MSSPSRSLNLDVKGATAVRCLAPIRLMEFDPVPGLLRLLDQMTERKALSFMFHAAQETPFDQQARETIDLGMFVEKRPVKPAYFVILTVGIVIAELTPANLVTHD